jgi:DNA-binding response OmpR family regulator
VTILPKILLIDDDVSIYHLLERILKERYLIESATNGIEAEQKLTTTQYEVVIFDLRLEYENGMHLLKHLRDRNIIRNSKVFILTSDNTTETEVAGHEIGVDEFIRKPFIPEIFLAILDKHIKSLREDKKTLLTYGSIQVDLSSLVVSIEQGETSKEVNLTSKEFQILVSLIQSAGKVLTREGLYHSIWHKESDNLQRTLDMYVSSLRKKLGAAGSTIKTIRSSGYKIDLTD